MAAPDIENGVTGAAIAADQFAMFMDAFALQRDTKAVAVAVSGGPDSMALVRLVHDWAGPRNTKVFALTVDHRLRSESAAEAFKVGEWLTQLDIPHETLIWQDGETVKHLDRSPQAAARDGRFELMEQWCESQDINVLMTAHHADDQAETFLMRLIRGSGVDGLAAMSADTTRGSMRVLRPLLGVTKADLIATCEVYDQSWVHDPSNDSDSYARTRVRKIMAALESEGLDRDRLLKTVTHMQRAQSAIDSAVSDLFEKAVREGDGNALALDIQFLCAAPDEVALRCLARCLKRVSGSTYAPRFESLDRVYGDLKPRSSSNPWTDRTLHGCQLRKVSDHLTIAPEGKRG